jgi:hypothetical protein
MVKHVRIPINEQRAALLGAASSQQILEKLKELAARTRKRVRALLKPEPK